MCSWLNLWNLRSKDSGSKVSGGPEDGSNAGIHPVVAEGADKRTTFLSQVAERARLAKLGTA
eukprot:11422312-Alexandrium_andersonii.AAC.1